MTKWVVVDTDLHIYMITRPNCGRASLSCYCCWASQSCPTLEPHGLWHARLPCLSPSPGACSKSCPLNRWCHPTISSSVIRFSSCLQSFPASGSFQMSQLFALGGQSIGASASSSVLPMNIQVWFPLGLTGWICLLSKRLWRVFCSITIRKYQLFGAQPSLWSNSHIHTWLLEKPQLWIYGPLLAKWWLLFNMLPRFVWFSFQVF